MSHFALLVVTNEVPTEGVLQKALQPFHEFECTGTVDEYVQSVDITEQVKEQLSKEGTTLVTALDYFGLEDKIIESENDAETYEDGAHQYGYAVVTNGVFIKAIDRTNPNKKWDWWCIGGRYSNRLRVKGDSVAIDSAAVANIDFDAMLHDRKRAAHDRLHEAVQKLMLKHPGMKMDQEQVLKLWAAGVVALKAARHIWEEQGKVVAFHEFLKTHEPENAFAYASGLGVMQELEWSGGFPDDQADLLAYIEGLPAISTFAFLMPDGKWYEQGEMGWWGCVSNEDKVAFDISFKQMLDSLAPDQFITFVDCHI